MHRVFKKVIRHWKGRVHTDDPSWTKLLAGTWQARSLISVTGPAHSAAPLTPITDKTTETPKTEETKPRLVESWRRPQPTQETLSQRLIEADAEGSHVGTASGLGS